MPDWFYRPVARPLLFRLPHRLARGIALGFLGALARLPGGGRLIDFLGHLRADPALSRLVADTRYPSPLLLGWRIDPEGRAFRAFARFGAGGFVAPASHEVPDITRSADALQESSANRITWRGRAADGLPVLRHVRENPCGGEWLLTPDGARWPVLPWDQAPVDQPAAGVALQVGQRAQDGRWKLGLSAPEDLPRRVAEWRAALGPERPLVVWGGVAEPSDAVALMRAGADLLVVEAGLVFSGPGLIKRANAAMLADGLVSPQTKNHDRPRTHEVAPDLRQSWFWAASLGAAMLAGGALALGLASSSVLLPYDEHYLGLTAADLARLNPRLLAFMAHDRATLAGVMLGLGWLYWRLSKDGIRRGDHAAWLAVSASALTGFFSFFYFLGFGYFDPLHAFVTAILFQILLLVLVGERGAHQPASALDRKEDGVWRRAQWGQLLLVVHAVGLLIAGAVISIIGLTHVFVAEDLAFLCIAPGEVSALGERLVSVVAHDRATLGGMLLATGIASLLPTLWSFDRGARALRNALAGLGAPAYAAAIGVHYAVGYLDWRHLLPAWLGFALWAGGLALTWNYLGAKSQAR